MRNSECGLRNAPTLFLSRNEGMVESKMQNI
jgi:hypothetical protein